MYVFVIIPCTRLILFRTDLQEYLVQHGLFDNILVAEPPASANGSVAPSDDSSGYVASTMEDTLGANVLLNRRQPALVQQPDTFEVATSEGTWISPLLDVKCVHNLNRDITAGPRSSSEYMDEADDYHPNPEVSGRLNTAFMYA